MTVIRSALVAVAAWVVAFSPAAADTFGRALVAVNTAYASLPPLTGRNERAREIAGALEAAGVAVDLHVDASAGELLAAIPRLVRDLPEGEPLVFVWSGHTARLDEQVFLLPVGAGLRTESDLRTQGIALSMIERLFGRAPAGMRLLVLDGAWSGLPGLSGRGLPPPPVLPGTATILSIAPNTVKPDQRTPDPFAAALVDALGRPDRPLQELLAALETRAGELGRPPVVAVDPAIADLHPFSVEERDWRRLGPAPDVAALEAFLAAHPQGRRYDEAKALIAARTPPPVQAAAAMSPSEPAAPNPSAAEPPEETTAPEPVTMAPADPVAEGRAFEASLSWEDWRAIQTALRRLGLYTGPVDGDAGRGTRAAIRAVQERWNQPATGWLTRDQFDRLLTP